MPGPMSGFVKHPLKRVAFWIEEGASAQPVDQDKEYSDDDDEPQQMNEQDILAQLRPDDGDSDDEETKSD